MSSLNLLTLTLTYIYTAIAVDHVSQTASEGNSARFKCDILSDDCEKRIYWYKQGTNANLEYILYISDGKATYRKGFSMAKYQVGSASSLAIKNLNKEDHAVYYCACWTGNWKAFGKGTKLIVTSQPVRGPEVTILKSSMKDVEEKGVTIYMCSLQNYFPDVISVAWKKGDTKQDMESEQGEIEHNANTNTYSLNSWITVRKSDLGTFFTYEYKHEATRDVWKETAIEGKEYVPEVPKNISQGMKCNQNYDPAEEVPKNISQGMTCSKNYDPAEDLRSFNHMTYRAAQLTYGLLLFKSYMYCPLLFFIKYKTIS